MQREKSYVREETNEQYWITSVMMQSRRSICGKKGDYESVVVCD